MRASRFLSVLLSPFRSFSFRSLLSPGRYKRSRIELKYVRLHTSYWVLKPRYFNPTYKQQVTCTFSSALHVPNDFSSRHTNAHKACAFMHKQSWSTASAPLPMLPNRVHLSTSIVSNKEALSLSFLWTDASIVSLWCWYCGRSDMTPLFVIWSLCRPFRSPPHV